MDGTNPICTYSARKVAQLGLSLALSACRAAANFPKSFDDGPTRGAGIVAQQAWPQA